MTNPSLASRCQRPAPPPKRIVWMDYARAFAILTVLLCHATEKAYSFQLDSILSTSLPSQTAAFCLFTVGRLGVPIFLFMSGYLMLDRDYSREKCLTFWRTKWLGLFLATEFWIAAYNIFLCLSTGRDFSVGLLIKNMLFLENVGMGHMWYMPMIIGLYLFLPFIANGLRKLDDPKLLLFPLACALVLFLGIPLLSILSQSFGHGALRCEIAEGFSGGAYGCYMLLGYCVKKFPLRDRVKPILLATLFLLCFLATVSLQIFAYSKGIFAPVWYTNGLLLAAGFFLFLLFSCGAALRNSRVISTLSYYSFALYLVHFPILMLLAPHIASLGIESHVAQVALLLSADLAISLALCIAIARIPNIGSRILYLK